MQAMPAPVRGIDFDQFWHHVRQGQMHLQRCTACRNAIYPPAPACPLCLSMDLRWEPVSGHGTITSCVRFHRTYLPEYPAPYTVLAVRLQEGPLFVTTLESDAPLATLMGQEIRIAYRDFENGDVLPIATLTNRLTV